MLDFKNQTFGMELEFTGISREHAARVVQRTLTGDFTYRYRGGAYRVCAAYDLDGREWKVESDSSINTEGGDQCEFVTPICVYDDIPTIQEIVRQLRHAGAKVNSSCGIHVHVGASNHNARTLRNLIYIFRAKEDLIFRAVGTRTSRLGRWCRPIDDDLIETVRKIPSRALDSGAMADAWYGTYAPFERRDAHYNTSRYHALNLHAVWTKGTVEFRLFEATLHAGEIRAYINLALAINAMAINASRASATVTATKLDDYHTMRCFLVHLGFNGDDWKNVRMHLLKNFKSAARAAA